MAFIDNNDKLTLRVGNMAVSALDTYWSKDDEQFEGSKGGYHVHDFADTIVSSSKVVARRPRLLGRGGEANKVDKILSFQAPAGCEFCNDCGEWRPRSYFAANPSYARGVDYFCKQCKSAQDRRRRELVAIDQGRELRPYKRRWAA